ncbi:MAG TPA: hemerythrin domain-containing protein [Paraburkholderia sp.]|nr:hemerythrin domain-containing protein [Paraburkholderia sp.]
MATDASRHPTSEQRHAANAVEWLMHDHRTVEKLFDAYQKAGDDDLAAKGTLAQRACEALSVHTILEEEILYPAAQKALDKHALDVEEAYVEHFLVKTLISRFASMKPGDAGFDASFKVMSELVRHHIEEEESELFPALKKSNADLVALGKALDNRNAQLRKKLDEAGSRNVGDNTLAFTGLA